MNAINIKHNSLHHGNKVSKTLAFGIQTVFVSGFVIKPCQFQDCVLQIKEIGGKYAVCTRICDLFGRIKITVLL